jgi:hypothetical protein
MSKPRMRKGYVNFAVDRGQLRVDSYFFGLPVRDFGLDCTWGIARWSKFSSKSQLARSLSLDG